jgi:hypothetical protein
VEGTSAWGRRCWVAFWGSPGRTRTLRPWQKGQMQCVSCMHMQPGSIISKRAQQTTYQDWMQDPGAYLVCPSCMAHFPPLPYILPCRASVLCWRGRGGQDFKHCAVVKDLQGGSPKQRAAGGCKRHRTSPPMLPYTSQQMCPSTCMPGNVCHAE